MTEIDGLRPEDILPHREGMLLIDEIISVEDTYAVTETVIKESHPMAEKGGVSSLILLELAAQTAGVCNGLGKIKSDGKEASRKGWLVGVKRAQFFVDDLIAFGSRLVIRSENRHEFDMLREVFCVVHLDGTLLGEITLQLIEA